ncbi:hypothetical protein QWY85_08680 [Neolewinella lacunae]|uniref:DUF5667 domain-containing protein n=1 Tax=Neolewinella lacunae TaxID=1517758 RepID=A0A923TCE5_9BACT|nr:hypothetical protein [Neolewinella lacunae]MBC6993642.1 hypothetical protein [Neolewinella lacunae]MDN3634730.1 hypothetical protein [Neolewinella lacunae]
MKEKNEARLREALGRLPEYDPPAGVWEDLAAQLPPELQGRLPSYPPPAEVWNAVSRQLDTAQQPGVERPLRSLPRLPFRWSAVAAVLLLVLGATAVWRGIDPGPKVTYSYGQEISRESTVADWDNEESSFDRVLAEIEARNEPNLNTLRLELDELTEAKEDIKAMLVAYGEDPEVVRQLAEIERDRSDVYRRIIVEL